MGNILCCCNESKVHQEPEESVIQAETGNTIGRLLVFVNPTSGAGKGLQTFHSKVKPELERNNIACEFIATTGPRHAKSIVTTRENISSFNGIVILSGDGLVYEVINGICERKDAEAVLKNLPIAIVPSGSGNGLLASLFASHGWPLTNPSFTKKAIEVATSPTSHGQPINLFHVQTPSENIAAFLSIGWGLMADIDIESEKYRTSLGSNRFVISALVRCMNLRTYKGKLSYKEHVPLQENPIASYPIYGERQQCIRSDNSVIETIESDIHNRPRDEFWSRNKPISFPTVDEQVPEDWVVLEDEFIGVYAVSLSHISADGHFMPGAKMDDDKLFLSYILKKDVKSKAQLIKMLLAIEEGKHVEFPYFKRVQVSAFRLEPLTEEPLLVVDGEVIDARILQASTSNLKAFIFS